MSKYFTRGNVTALLAVAAIIAGAFGKSALASFLNNPDTAQTILSVLGALGTLAAGAMQGVKQ
jgi:large-conductance mechanosensitive channel